MIPTPFTVQVLRLVESGTDHGNPVQSWAAGVDLPVHAVWPGAMDLPGQPGRDVSKIVYTLLAPRHPNLPHDLDKVVIDGGEYRLAGRVSDWTRGPWVFPDAGCSVELERWEG